MVSKVSFKCDLNTANESMILFLGKKRKVKKKFYKNNFFLFPLGAKAVKTEATFSFSF